MAPVLTPFGLDGAPDVESYIEHCVWLLENGCSALVPFGTTSEANSLGLDERMELLEELVDADVDPALLMPGTGMCSVTDAAVLTQHAVDIGCSGVLMLPPFYYKQPSDEGLYQYYAHIIEEVADDRLRIYLYHIPQVSQVGISLDLIERLRKDFPATIVGIKDSSGDEANLMAILRAHPDLEVFPGTETLLLSGLKAGAVGVISATANINCAQQQQIYANWQSASAEPVQAAVSQLRATIKEYAAIPLLKAILAYFRDTPSWRAVRPPLLALSDDQADAAVRQLVERHALTMAVN